KGFDCSIRAVRRLLDAGLDLEYEIVGAGEERAALDSLIRELALSGRVRLLGAKRDHEVSQLYQRAHLFVLPSVRSPRGDEETQGLVVQEAQANGLPVVVSDVGGIREGIAENESGLVFRAGDVDHLAKVLRGLIQRKDQWPEMGRAGR